MQYLNAERFRGFVGVERVYDAMKVSTVNRKGELTYNCGIFVADAQSETHFDMLDQLQHLPRKLVVLDLFKMTGRRGRNGVIIFDYSEINNVTLESSHEPPETRRRFTALRLARIAKKAHVDGVVMKSTYNEDDPLTIIP